MPNIANVFVLVKTSNMFHLRQAGVAAYLSKASLEHNTRDLNKCLSKKTIVFCVNLFFFVANFQYSGHVEFSSASATYFRVASTVSLVLDITEQ